MAADQVPGLGEGNLGGAVDENRGGTEGGNDQDHIHLGGKIVMEETDRADTQEGADPGPEDLGEAHARGTFPAAGHFFEVIHLCQPFSEDVSSTHRSKTDVRTMSSRETIPTIFPSSSTTGALFIFFSEKRFPMS